MHPEFPSDIFLLLETVGARLVVAEAVDKMMEVSVQEFMSPEMDMNKRLLLTVYLPAIKMDTTQVLTYKVGIGQDKISNKLYEERSSSKS